MGLRALPGIIVQFVMLLLSLTVMSLPVIAIFKVLILKKVSVLILFITIVLATLGIFLNITFFFYAAPLGFFAIYFILQFLKSIIFDPIYIATPMPGYISYPLTIINPS